MLNTTSAMAFSDHLAYMTPTRSSARGVRRPLTMSGRDCAGDYFASSADFEYDLFLHGLVTCDSALPSSSSSSFKGGSSSASGFTAATTSSSSSSASSSFSTSGFFSRYRASRPVSTASPSASRQQHQQSSSSSGHRSNQSLLTTLSITSLNRSSAYEQPFYSSYYHQQQQQPSDDSHYQTVSRPSLFGGAAGFGEPHQQQQTGICSQQHRMKNMLASNLSLGSSVPMNSTAAAASFRPNMLEEMLHVRNREKQKAALKQTTDPQLDPGSVNVDNLSHQQLHALHRFRRQKKKGFLCRLRDVVISFTPKARMSIVNRPDLFVRFGLAEKEALACFDYLDKEDHQATTEELADAAVEEILVTTDDLLAEWKRIEKEEEKAAKAEKSSVEAKSSINASPVPPLSCDTSLKAPLTSTTSNATCSSPAAMIKEEFEEKVTVSGELFDGYSTVTLATDQADSSISSVSSSCSMATDHKLMEDSGSLPLSSSTTPAVLLDDGNSSVSRGNSGKASKKKSKQKKAKVGKSR